MRALIQRVRYAAVTVGETVTGKIDAGLRIVEDDAGRMNRSLTDIGGAMLVVSQFTLFADATQGRRPYFGNAAPPELAEELYEVFKREAAKFAPVESGRFGADMQVSLCNDGPVTIPLEAFRRPDGKISLK